MTASAAWWPTRANGPSATERFLTLFEDIPLNDTASRPAPHFGSDNVAGASPEIIAALAACNAGPAQPYGADELSARVEQRLCALFEREVAVFLVSTGTAANALALSVLAPPFGAVLCHPDSHIDVDECGAPEFYTGGAKLVHVPGPHGKIDPGALAARAGLGAGDVHSVQAACVSLTQASELGTVYSLEETRAIGALCRQAGLTLHMDGARFANALVSLDASAADMTWRAGVDVLSFGATKNGALGVEAVVVFDPAHARTLGLRRKRGGHLASKMRFLAAQMDAYLEGDLWLANARHANAMAQRLAAGLHGVDGVAMKGSVDANILFVRLPAAVIEGLRARGFRFYTDRWEPGVVRLVTSFATTPDDVDRLVEAVISL